MFFGEPPSFLYTQLFQLFFFPLDATAMSMSSVPTACVRDDYTELPPDVLGKPPARHYLDMYANQPDDDTPFVPPDTLKERDRVWNSWVRFCDESNLKVKMLGLLLRSILRELKPKPRVEDFSIDTWMTLCKYVRS
ncbi:hypothetical protein F5B21DRAFT_195923 [Xylaria acuta]|nr:hypothetical protein F5B21DRAFT_195923 [Xylaria acuta]